MPQSPFFAPESANPDTAKLSPGGLAQARLDLSAGCVVDAGPPGAPLFISFACTDWTSPGHFELEALSERIASRLGTRVNRVFLRDTGSLCYQLGAPGMGHSAAELERALAQLVSHLKPSHILIAGQGMGGHAALQFGSLLQQRFGKVHILALSPLSFLDPELANAEGDLRFMPMMRCLADRQPAGWVRDIAADLKHLAATGTPLDCTLILGTAESPPAGDNQDALHAIRFQGIEGVSVQCFDKAGHGVLQWLEKTGRLDEVIEPFCASTQAAPATEAPAHTDSGLRLQFGQRTAADGSQYQLARVLGFTAPPAIDAEWEKWIAENLLLGRAPLDLLYRLVASGFDAAAARASLTTIANSPAMAASQRLASRLAKRDWLLGVLRKNDALDARHRSIPVVPAMSTEDFLQSHYAAGRPVVMKGAFDAWPARQKWTPDYILERCGDCEVSVQMGREGNARYETQAEQHRKIMRLSEYIAALKAVETEGGSSNNFYITAGNSGVNETALAPLWPDTEPALEAYLDTRSSSRNGFFWMGPRGTFTPLHHDLTHNFMAQVMGRKHIWLVNPLHTPSIYNQLHCFSDVDLRKVDFDRHPLMRDVEVFEHVLEPGELLFIPIGWWHQVVGVDTTITMTYTNFRWPNDYAKNYHTYGPV